MAGETIRELFQRAGSNWRNVQPEARRRALFFVMIFVLAFAVRGLTMQFMRDHLTDASWFQFGSYSVFDKRARNILDGRDRMFWIDDASRTDLVQYPPAFPWWIAAIYRITDERSMYAVQRIQWVLDTLLVMFLITGIAVTAYGWRAGVATSFVAALSPLLAMYGAWPSSDGPTAWFVLGGVWLLLVAARRGSVKWAFGAGVALGVACWFRVNPLYLTFGWALALLFLVASAWKRRIALSAAVMLGAFLVISPIVIRNYAVFPDFTPTGGTIGVNLWEGLGETELGRSYGFQYGDDKLVEHERKKMGLSADFPLEPFWPDGIRRDRERVSESLAFIKTRPIWYMGVMLHRMWGMLKVAGAPLPYYGSAGINVTSRKCLPPHLQGTVLAFFVNAIGMTQSVLRYLLLPLVAIGLWIGFRRDRLMSTFLLTTILYYLVLGTTAHTEIRYMLPMHQLLTIFGGLTICQVADIVIRRRRAKSIGVKGERAES